MKGLATLLSSILFASLFVGCSRSATTHADASSADAEASSADADAETDILGDVADAGATALLSPIRFHLRNDGPGDVYLGLRVLDQCAFDYTVTRLDPSDGGDDAGTASVIIEPPMCLCRPSCSGCGTCWSGSCDELCDETPPRIAPGQERVLTWDGRRFTFVCEGVSRCAMPSPAALGRYGLTVPVYDTAAQTIAPARSANLSFELRGSSVEGTDIELSIRLP